MYRAFLLAILFCACCPAQRILMVTDMEGVGGVNNADEQLLPGQRRYEESRRLLHGEVNAAVAGAAAAGAKEIVIWDGHDGSRSLSVDEIDPRAALIQGRSTPADYYMAPKRFDGVMFVGQHAMANAKGGVLSHSQSFGIELITLNGKPVGEIGQVAAIAGYFDIPVIMLSGDEAACEEIRQIQPNAVTVAVKHLAGKGSSWSLSHPEAKRRITEAARKAVAQIHEYKPWKVETPVEMKFVYKPESKDAEPRTKVYHGQTVLECYQDWLGR